MASVHPKTGIELLQKQVERGRALIKDGYFRGNEHGAWQNTTRVFLGKAFGKESEAVREFLKKSEVEMSIYNLSSFYSDILTSQLAYLGSCIEILEAEKEQDGENHSIKQLAQSSQPVVSTDPFKRRYQVFVSSTYEDLKEERRHVMQALLETMCIPTGMELFPAAGEEQSKLIERVIDDCDYYVVIVAGRYGSIGPKGKSYTEMEFDYALSVGKPVIGFYHSDIKALSFRKVEEKDEGRQRLAAFAEKIKKRICKSWDTPEGLASAVKSAILYAIQNDPKPGWVRASDLASSAAISSLRRSVETSGRNSTKRESSDKGKPIEVRAKVSFWEVDDPKCERPHWDLRKSHLQTIEFSEEELFLILGPRLATRRPRKTLKMFLEEQYAERIKRGVPQTSGKHNIGYRWELVTDDVQKILDTFVARKLVKIVQPPKGLSIKVSYWEITPKGQQRLAELRTAI